MKNVELLKTWEPTELCPRGAALVWNYNEKGLIRRVYCQDPYQTEGESYLLMDDEPLVLVIGGCPTCRQLLRAGGMNKEQSDYLAGLIEKITIDAVASMNVSWLETVYPIIELFPSGPYFISVLDHFPTDGEGRFFWVSHEEPVPKRALLMSQQPSLDDLPVFLTSTQPTGNFDHNLI